MRKLGTLVELGPRLNSGATVGLGVAYTWMRSERAAFD